MTMQTQQTYTVLVVDDNWYNRDVFRIALENASYQVFEADNGLTGLELLSKRTFDLLVLDLQMPDIDGHEVLRRLRTDSRHDSMRVLVVTAQGHMATSDLDQEVDHIMFKPIDVVQFSHFTDRLKRTFVQE